MQMRLEKAERALEQERATVRELQHALQAAQHVSSTILAPLHECLATRCHEV
jgi:hypothetical protein